MTEVVFDSKLLPDGHLFCPKEIAKKKNAKFKVIATFEDPYNHATDNEIEAAAIQDASDDFLSKDELDYYLNLKEL